jgi:hypothetical protein
VCTDLSPISVVIVIFFEEGVGELVLGHSRSEEALQQGVSSVSLCPCGVLLSADIWAIDVER